MFGIDISPLVMKLIGAGLVVIAIGIAWFSFAKHYENKGRDKLIMQDQGAVNNAKARIRTVDECEAAGRTWDVTVLPNGLCLD